MTLFAELKRRNVFRVGIAYIVLGWVLLQVADVVVPILELPDWAAKLVLFLLVIGFPVILFFAWAYELTPEGVKREQDVDRNRSISMQTGKKLDRAIIGILTVAVALLLFDRFRLEAPEPRERRSSDAGPAIEAPEIEPAPSIAILPFENMSGNPAHEPFAIGIHDDLLTQVSKIGSLRTISRTSVLQFRNTTRTIPEIASELGVTTVLEGGVQRAGNQVRINVQLIKAKTDENLWAETYDRELSAANIFAIQSEIATAISGALKANLSAADQARLSTAPTRSLSALEAYFRGKRLADSRAEKNLREAIEFFDLAISLDPDFALAHAGRSYAWLLIPEYDAGQDREESKRISREAAERALELQPDLPEGLVMSAWIQLREYHWDAAEALLLRVLELHSTNVDAMHWLSHIESWQGRHPEALATARRAVEVDPLSPLMLMNLSYIQMDARLYEDSIRTRDRTLQVKMDMHEQMRNIWFTFLRAGRYAEAANALITWAEGTGRDPEKARWLGQALQRHGITGEYVELPRDLLDDLELGTENLGQIYAAAGDAEATLAELRIALEERAGSRSVLSMKINPLYDFIRADPRFQAMLQEVNLAP